MDNEIVVVDGYATHLHAMDDDGVVWLQSLRNVTPPRPTHHSPLYFALPDCAGTAYVSPGARNHAFSINGMGAFVARPSAATYQALAFQSVEQQGDGEGQTCVNATGDVYAVEEAEAEAVTPPDTLFVPPVRTVP